MFSDRNPEKAYATASAFKVSAAITERRPEQAQERRHDPGLAITRTAFAADQKL